ncbi:MAG: biopolymer transporter ExbD [Bacteriovoracaceae bacterium]|nr:biopolymer transporter ExbD [Bacteriovoracaceae bacterium]
MYRVPSRKKKKHKISAPNLIPILDAVFIFIFFLLMSANFTKIFEISSDIPIVSNQPPPKSKKPPLALTLKLTANDIKVYTGVPSTYVKRFGRMINGQYDLLSLHDYLIKLKKRHVREKSIIVEPIVDIKYEELVKVMDSVRTLSNTDEAIYQKDKDGLDVRIKDLFSKIVFGNIGS